MKKVLITMTMAAILGIGAMAQAPKNEKLYSGISSFFKSSKVESLEKALHDKEIEIKLMTNDEKAKDEYIDYLFRLYNSIDGTIEYEPDQYLNELRNLKEFKYFAGDDYSFLESELEAEIKGEPNEPSEFRACIYEMIRYQLIK